MNCISVKAINSTVSQAESFACLSACLLSVNTLLSETLSNFQQPAA